MPETQEAEAEAETGESDDRPEIPDDAMAAMDEGTAADVEAEFGAGETPNDDPMGDMAADAAPTGGASMGEFYTRALSLLAHVLSDKYGDGGSTFYDENAPEGEKIDTTLAKELQLHEHVDALMAKRGRSDLPPGQALAVGTAMFAIAVIATEPALMDKIMEKTGGGE